MSMQIVCSAHAVAEVSTIRASLADLIVRLDQLETLVVRLGATAAHQETETTEQSSIGCVDGFTDQTTYSDTTATIEEVAPTEDERSVASNNMDADAMLGHGRPSLAQDAVVALSKSLLEEIAAPVDMTFHRDEADHSIDTVVDGATTAEQSSPLHTNTAGAEIALSVESPKIVQGLLGLASTTAGEPEQGSGVSGAGFSTAETKEVVATSQSDAVIASQSLNASGPSPAAAATSLVAVTTEGPTLAGVARHDGRRRLAAVIAASLVLSASVSYVSHQERWPVMHASLSDAIAKIASFAERTAVAGRAATNALHVSTPN